MDPTSAAKLARLEKLSASVRTGGKGTPRRAMKKTHKATLVDDKKLHATIKKLNCQDLTGIESVSLVGRDGSEMVIRNASVSASVNYNTTVVIGKAKKEEGGVPDVATFDDDEMPELV